VKTEVIIAAILIAILAPLAYSIYTVIIPRVLENPELQFILRKSALEVWPIALLDTSLFSLAAWLYFKNEVEKERIFDAFREAGLRPLEAKLLAYYPEVQKYAVIKMIEKTAENLAERLVWSRHIEEVEVKTFRRVFRFRVKRPSLKPFKKKVLKERLIEEKEPFHEASEEEYESLKTIVYVND